MIVMVEGALFRIAEQILATLASEILKNIRLPLGYKDELRKLERTISQIKAVLLDAEKKKEINERVNMWLQSLEELLYDADNLMEKFRYQQLRRRVVFGKKKAKKVRIFFLRSNQLVFRLKMARKVKQIREKLDEIKASQVFSQLVMGPEETHVPSTMRWRETHSFVIDDEVIGRDDDKRKMLGLLLLDNNIEDRESVSIISLVGIGGLGKTTLAQFVFNDELVKRHFDKRMWVCVSDFFDRRSLFEKVIRSATKSGLDEKLTLDELQFRVGKEIEGKRYLLVLDDVWNDKHWHEWDRLKTLLKLGKKGSKVLITTRNTRVAKIADSTKIYMLSDLGEDKSWDLFERVALNAIDKTTSLVEIGKDIVKECKGVPLAIKTVGQLLQSKQYSLENLEMEWKLFRDHELKQVDRRKESDILHTLKLSYDDLPLDLKRCFAYCSLFPKDHRINVQQLIKLWIAQGFIKPDEARQPEDSGYEYFMILFSRCFFQEAEKDELSTTIEYCKLHNLMHDLASLVAGNSIKIINDSDPTNEKVFHLYADFPRHSSCQIPKKLLEQKKMRTFILPNYVRWSSLDFHDVLSNFKLLRALTLRIQSPDMETLPNSLGKLKHLRYLDLSNNPYIKELPTSITKLYNLQTLILSSCSSLVNLPIGIQNLINLRHLEIRDCRKLIHMPRGIGELTSLQTLDRFVVADDKASESAGLGELSKLNNLRGCLTIKIFRLGESCPEQCLKDKKHLQSLVLSWEVEETTGDYAEKAFECLVPPQNIKSIQVLSYSGQTFPDYFYFLTNLVRLEFSGCEKCKCLPPLHDLSSLQELKLNSLSALEYVSEMDREWNTGVCFPSLTTLVISECLNLKGWWGTKGKDFGEALTEIQQPSFPLLSKLTILHCPLLTAMPSFPNLQDLKLHNANSKALDSAVAAIPSKLFSPSSSSPSPLSQLRHLDIQFVDDLESLLPKAIHNLSLLQSLSINNCLNLASIPEGLSNLTRLEKLQIFQCPKLTSLPEGMDSLSSLAYLTIVRCDNLASIPQGISSLLSLTYITIVGCSNMTKIPKEIGSLPSLKVINGEPCTEIPMDALADYLLRQNSPA